MLFESLRPAMILSARARRPDARALPARAPPGDRHAARARDRGARRHAGDRGRLRALAAGLALRERYGDALTYVEADLPGMAARKRRALERIGSLGRRPPGRRARRAARRRAREPRGAGRAASTPTRGLAIITEGLLGYLPGDAVTACGGASPRSLRGFAAGRYLSDLHLGDAQTPQVRGVPAAALGVRARPRPPALRRRARGRGGAARGRLRRGAVHRAATLAPEAAGTPAQAWRIYLRHQPD